MSTATYGGKGVKERASVSGERSIGAATCRQQYNQVMPPPGLYFFSARGGSPLPPPLGPPSPPSGAQ